MMGATSCVDWCLIRGRPSAAELGLRFMHDMRIWCRICVLEQNGKSHMMWIRVGKLIRTASIWGRADSAQRVLESRSTTQQYTLVYAYVVFSFFELTSSSAFLMLSSSLVGGSKLACWVQCEDSLVASWGSA